jgi:hypothetical protein
MAMQVFVTGGSGYIGQATIAEARYPYSASFLGSAYGDELTVGRSSASPGGQNKRAWRCTGT